MAKVLVYYRFNVKNGTDATWRYVTKDAGESVTHSFGASPSEHGVAYILPYGVAIGTSPDSLSEGTRNVAQNDYAIDSSIPWVVAATRNSDWSGYRPYSFSCGNVTQTWYIEYRIYRNYYVRLHRDDGSLFWKDEYYGERVKTWESTTSIPDYTGTNPGYHFVGWREIGGNTVYRGSIGPLKIQADERDQLGCAVVDLYPVWEPDNIRIAVSGNGNAYLFNSNGEYITSTSNGASLSHEGTVGGRYTIKGEVYPDKSSSTKILGLLVNGSYYSEYTFILGQSGFEATYYFAAKDLCSITTANTPPGGGTVSYSPNADSGGKWYEGREITARVSPSPGYSFDGWKVKIGSNPAVDGTNDGTNSFRFYITASTNVELYYSKVRYLISAGIDPASAGHGSVSVTYEDGSELVDGKAEYGERVKFSATPDNGYLFEGWYDGVSTSPVSTSAEYVRTVTGAVSLAAKFKVAVSLTFAFEDNRDDPQGELTETGSLAVNGTNYSWPDQLPFVGHCTLGSSVSYSVTPGTIPEMLGGSGWNFAGWYDSGDTQFENPLDYPQSGTITPSAGISLVARFTSVVKTYRVTVRTYDISESGGGLIEPSAENPLVTIEGIDAEIDDGAYVFSVTGTRKISVNAADSATHGQNELVFNAHSRAAGLDEEDILSFDQNFAFFLNSDRTIYVIYGTSHGATVTVAYADDANRSMGYLGIDDETNEGGGASVSKTGGQGTRITLSARPKNGYRFVGWFLFTPTAGTPWRTGNVEILITSTRTVYAKFEEDPNSIYEWEGSSENKMAVWRSKVYVSPRPFNPSAVRVDAIDSVRLRPVADVKVLMRSSPDGEPTSVTELVDVSTYKARRLPHRRPERYLQVEVQNDEEVDRIIVGTSMEGLAV